MGFFPSGCSFSSLQHPAVGGFQAIQTTTRECNQTPSIRLISFAYFLFNANCPVPFNFAKLLTFELTKLKGFSVKHFFFKFSSVGPNCLRLDIPDPEPSIVLFYIIISCPRMGISFPFAKLKWIMASSITHGLLLRTGREWNRPGLAGCIQLPQRIADPRNRQPGSVITVEYGGGGTQRLYPL